MQWVPLVLSSGVKQYGHDDSHPSNARISYTYIYNLYTSFYSLRIFQLISLGGVRLSLLGISVKFGLLHQFWMIMRRSVEQSEWKLAKETEVLRENL
jgi:hypothetical protein